MVGNIGLELKKDVRIVSLDFKVKTYIRVEGMLKNETNQVELTDQYKKRQRLKT